ncbi:lantibiotic dehydratase C-terminal domain-containing protein [Streptomyces aculeolatus]
MPADRTGQPGRPGQGSRTAAEGRLLHLLTVVAPGEIRRLRAADPGAAWGFSRPARASGTHPIRDLELWFRARTDVLADVNRRLHAAAAGHGQPAVTEDYAPPTAKYRSERTLRAAQRLATVSSDFALALLAAGRPRPAERLPLAAAHLRRVSALTTGDARAALLFHLWQYATDGLAPEHRLRLTAEAEAQARDFGNGHAPWDTHDLAEYADAVAHAAGRPGDGEGPGGDGVPVNFLLFDHAWLTHERLGISSATTALAAVAVRSALAAESASAAAAR